MQPFAVVIALLSVAAAGWLLSRAARRLLRRHDVPTDEGDVPDVSEPVWRETPDGKAGDGSVDRPPRSI